MLWGYHPSLDRVTIAFMGISYHLLQQLGFAKVSGRIASWQPGIYGGGQLMHIVGLAWSSRYNVARKSSDAESGIEQVAGMGLMGFGGLVSIIGGITFLVLIYRSTKGSADSARSK
jgi:cytochrome c oxidase subunit 1